MDHSLKYKQYVIIQLLEKDILREGSKNPNNNSKNIAKLDFVEIKYSAIQEPLLRK